MNSCEVFGENLSFAIAVQASKACSAGLNACVKLGNVAALVKGNMVVVIAKAISSPFRNDSLVAVAVIEIMDTVNGIGRALVLGVKVDRGIRNKSGFFHSGFSFL